MDKGPFLEQDPNQDWKYGESRLVLSLHPNFGFFFSPYGSLYISQGIDQETSLAEDHFLYSHVVNVLTLDVDLVVVV